MRPVFIPAWTVTHLASTPSENDGIQDKVEANLVATVMSTGDPIELAPADALLVTQVKVGGQIKTFQVEDNFLTVDAASGAVVEIILTGGLTYSTSMPLPPGVTMAPNGDLRGILGHVPSEVPVDFKFMVRAARGNMVSDQEITWTLIPEVSNLSWNMALPRHGFAGLVEYYDLGEFKLGQRVSFPIRVRNPDQVVYTIKSRTVAGLEVAPNRLNGQLPAGVTLTQTGIGGSIKPMTDSEGEYFIEVYVDHVRAPEPLVFRITVDASNLYDLEEGANITWHTPTVLGTIREGFASHLTVSASEVNGASVEYFLAPYSAPLPDGLTLLRTGEIAGILDRIDENSDFEFTVRAFTKGKYVDQFFSGKLVSLFADFNFIDVRFKLQGDMRRSLESQKNSFPEGLRFRPNDPAFELDGSVHVIRGLNDVGDDARLTRLDYRTDLNFTAGDLKLASVYDGRRLVYEVVYRELIDPLEKAGGYRYEGDTAFADPVAYPQDRSKIISPPSIRNIRADLVAEFGLNSADPAKSYVMGPKGGEGLPLWMTDEYVLGMVEGYAKPGLGTALLDHLRVNSVIRTGQNCLFDRFLVTHLEYSPTTFDDDCRALPILIPANETMIDLGRWTYRVIEIKTIDGQTLNHSIIDQQVVVPADTIERHALVYLKGMPQAGKLPASNARTSVETGIYGEGLVAITEDGLLNPITDYVISEDGTVTGISADTEEVVLMFGNMVLIDKNQRILWDNRPVVKPKYNKMKDTIVKSS